MTQATRADSGPFAQYRVGSLLLATLLLGTTGFGQRTALPAKLENCLTSAGTLSAHERRDRLAAERALDDVLADSFPANDPPSWTPGVTRPAPNSYLV